MFLLIYLINISNHMNNVKKIELFPLKEKFSLFLFFLSDISNYHKKKKLISNFPKVYTDLLNEIKVNTNIYNLLRKNHIKHIKKLQEKLYIIRGEKKIIKFEIKERKKITEKDIEKEILDNHNNYVKVKLSNNPLSLGQYKFDTIKLLYEPKNEITLISDILIKCIKTLISDCFFHSNLYKTDNDKKTEKKKSFLFQSKHLKKKPIIIKRLLRLKNPIYNTISKKNSFNESNNYWLSSINSFNGKNNSPINTTSASYNLKKYALINEMNNINSKYNINNKKIINLKFIFNNYEDSKSEKSGIKISRPMSEKRSKFNFFKNKNYSFSNKKNNIVKSNSWLYNRKSSFLNLKKYLNLKRIKDNISVSTQIIKNKEDKKNKIKSKFEYSYNQLYKLKDKTK